MDEFFNKAKAFFLKIKQTVLTQVKQGFFKTKHSLQALVAVPAVTTANNPTPPIQKIARTGLIVILVFFGGFMLWSFLFPIESGAVMKGTVIVDSYKKTIQHLEGGIVKKVSVDEGSTVKQGDVLLMLDDTQARANYQLWEEQFDFLQAKKARLIAERNNAATIDFPASLTQTPNTPGAKIAMIGEIAIFKARQALLAKTFAILDERVKQINAEIESLKAQADSSNKQLLLINEETEAVASLEARHLIERPRLLALQREQARLTGNRDENLALIAQAQQKIGEVQVQKIQMEQQREQQIAEDLQDTLGKLTDVEQKLLAARDVLTRMKVTAPIAGKVVDLKTHTIGGVIEPGATVMTIIPSQDRLVIEAKASPLDIDVIHTGLRAKIQFIALPRRSTPILNGIVTDVSADALTDEHTGIQYYTVLISITPKEFSRLGPDVGVDPGMPVEVLVVTEKQTLFAYFMEPLRNSFFKAFRET